MLRAEPPSRRKGLLATVAAGLLVVGLAVTGAQVASAGTSPLAANALAPTAGCGKAPGLNSGNHTIQSGGKNRSFILRLPDTYNNNYPHRLALRSRCCEQPPTPCVSRVRRRLTTTVAVARGIDDHR